MPSGGLSTKIDADGAIKHYKNRLVECGSQYLIGGEFGMTSAAVVGLITVKVMLALA